MTVTMTRRFEIDAGHRLQRHDGKCRNAHGHRYAFELTVGAAQLDEVGRVLDFAAVKQSVGGWLDEALDHGMVLEVGDPLLETLVGLKVHAVPFSPTIENLVRYVAEKAVEILGDKFSVERVVGWETPNCSATWERAR